MAIQPLTVDWLSRADGCGRSQIQWWFWWQILPIFWVWEVLGSGGVRTVVGGWWRRGRGSLMAGTPGRLKSALEFNMALMTNEGHPSVSFATPLPYLLWDFLLWFMFWVIYLGKSSFSFIPVFHFYTFILTAYSELFNWDHQVILSKSILTDCFWCLPGCSMVVSAPAGGFGAQLGLAFLSGLGTPSCVCLAFLLWVEPLGGIQALVMAQSRVTSWGLMLICVRLQARCTLPKKLSAASWSAVFWSSRLI